MCCCLACCFTAAIYISVFIGWFLSMISVHFFAFAGYETVTFLIEVCGGGRILSALSVHLTHKPTMLSHSSHMFAVGPH